MSNPPLCVRCAHRTAVACVRHKLGHKDAVCYVCMTAADTMLPLHWPGYDPVKEIGSSVREIYNAGDHQGAVNVLCLYAGALGLDADELHRMPATDAAIKGLQAIARLS